ncbi:hypothetical protein DV738_g5126, partial [Chaetothyriales sp. CBS 135597]
MDMGDGSDDEELPADLGTTASVNLEDLTTSSSFSYNLPDRTVPHVLPVSERSPKKRSYIEIYANSEGLIASTTPAKPPPRRMSTLEPTTAAAEAALPTPIPQEPCEETNKPVSTPARVPQESGREKGFLAEIQDYQQHLEAEYKQFELSLAQRDRTEPLQDMDWDELEMQYRQEQFLLWMQVSREKESERAIKRLKTRVAFVQNSERQLLQKQDHFQKVLEAFQAAMSGQIDLHSGSTHLANICTRNHQPSDTFQAENESKHAPECAAMKDDAGSNSSSRDLLARLNALKRSPIDLDQTSFPPSHLPPSEPIVDPSPARSLHADLVDRFKLLSGKTGSGSVAQSTEKSEDEKGVEELLADLGPIKEWEVQPSEHEQVEELLRAADAALAKGPVLEKVPGDEDAQHEQTAQKTELDVSVFLPEPDSKQGEESTAAGDEWDREADDVLKRLLDEVKLEEVHHPEHKRDVEGKQLEDEAVGSSDEQQGDDSSILIANLPSTPSKLPELPQGPGSTAKSDDDLASRFASLSLPSAPTASVQSGEKKFGKAGQGFTEDEIDSWCIICCDDATLNCPGCYGDLYCTRCWLEAHRGEMAGLEERRHKAVQYVKGKKKAKAKRIAMGA